MDIIREGNSTTRLPVLDEANYRYRKAQMTAFLMSLEIKCLRVVLVRSKPPIETDEASKVTRKSELIWSSAEDEAAVGNSQALNALFNVADQNVFKLINTCKLAKEAWDIFKVAYKGTSKVKISRLQILTSRFEFLRMTEEETIVEVNVRVLHIANKSDALGEKMSEAKLVKKITVRLLSLLSELVLLL
ncbi:gag-pol polyprotein [Cucumis melo var. makuwa]|uniref:Gag-pol polyprotein n=1 Tax=Cucumis melo var. makuwa TaxID=1194695 RepID=A0A5D3DZS6_CUCMM|nr:gag-pol polyprotein [Cucumis melo var. makuwa]TYK28835.1 gag-pol polyprotein [Cucumis melo var. makuwa]